MQLSHHDIIPDLNRAGLRPARAGGRWGQPGGGSWPRRPGRVRRPPTARGAGIARRGCGPDTGGGPPSDRGGDTAPPPLGEEGAAAEGAGEPGAALSGGEPELLWRSLAPLPGSVTRREQSLSASDLVIRPHWAAEIGSTRASLRAASWAGLQVEQNICSSSQAWKNIQSVKSSRRKNII